MSMGGTEHERRIQRKAEPMKPKYACFFHCMLGERAFITRLQDHEKLGSPEPPHGVHRLGSLTSPVVHHDPVNKTIETLNSIYVYGEPDGNGKGQ